MANSKISALTSATTPLAGAETLPIVQSGITKQVSIANVTAGRSVTMSKVTASGSGELAKLETSGNITAGGLAYLRFYDSVGARGYVGYVGTGALQITGSGDVELQPASGSNVLLTGANITQGTAAKGINFTANTPAAGMTSQLLNWYEEGTWTPTRNAFTEVLGAGSITSTGTYTRIGRTVHLYAQLVASGGATIAGVAGTSYFSGCPFTPISATPGTWVNSGTEAAGGWMSKRTTAPWVVVTSWAGSSSTWVFATTFFV